MKKTTLSPTRAHRPPGYRPGATLVSLNLCYHTFESAMIVTNSLYNGHHGNGYN